jgi:hypothetical protein
MSEYMTKRLILPILMLSYCLLGCADGPMSMTNPRLDPVLEGGLPPIGIEGGPLEAGMEFPDADASPTTAPAMRCVYRSESHGMGLRELDSAGGGATSLMFDIPGLPEPTLIESASLEFVSYDADHPGEEGYIWVGTRGPLDLPARVEWDNAMGTGVADISGLVRAGTNNVRFSAGPLERSFFRIGDVQIVALARISDCEAAPPAPGPPPATAVERRVSFWEASYTNRRNWVIPCRPGVPGHSAVRNYAFTAGADEHVPTDCDGGYIPGSNRRGTATFHFSGVARATYQIIVHARHTANRNPAGALFVVNGEGRRLSQVDHPSVYRDTVWGERPLEGDVEVVLDSSTGDVSDCVTHVRLVPIGG